MSIYSFGSFKIPLQLGMNMYPTDSDSIVSENLIRGMASEEKVGNKGESGLRMYHISYYV